MQGKIDLHLHTTHSDGILSVKELLQKAIHSGIKALSITDHDTIDGYIEALTLPEAQQLEILAGIEISCFENKQDFHLLGYGMDVHHPLMEKHLEIMRGDRERRSLEIIEKLATMGVSISFDKLKEYANGASITRPHIAEMLVREGYTNSLKEGFNRYLDKHKPAFVAKMNFTIIEACQLIHACGGVAIVAHPRMTYKHVALPSYLGSLGVDGIEISHPTQGRAIQMLYRQFARRNGFIVSGGSDYHGSRHYDEKNFGRNYMTFPELDSLKQRIAYWQSKKTTAQIVETV